MMMNVLDMWALVALAALVQKVAARRSRLQLLDEWTHAEVPLTNQPDQWESYYSEFEETPAQLPGENGECGKAPKMTADNEVVPLILSELQKQVKDEDGLFLRDSATDALDLTDLACPVVALGLRVSGMCLEVRPKAEAGSSLQDCAMGACYWRLEDWACTFLLHLEDKTCSFLWRLESQTKDGFVNSAISSMLKIDGCKWHLVGLKCSVLWRSEDWAFSFLWCLGGPTQDEVDSSMQDSITSPGLDIDSCQLRLESLSNSFLWRLEGLSCFFLCHLEDRVCFVIWGLEDPTKDGVGSSVEDSAISVALDIDSCHLRLAGLSCSFLLRFKRLSCSFLSHLELQMSSFLWRWEGPSKDGGGSALKVCAINIALDIASCQWHYERLACSFLLPLEGSACSLLSNGEYPCQQVVCEPVAVQNIPRPPNPKWFTRHYDIRENKWLSLICRAFKCPLYHLLPVLPFYKAKKRTEATFLSRKKYWPVKQECKGSPTLVERFFRGGTLGHAAPVGDMDHWQKKKNMKDRPSNQLELWCWHIRELWIEWKLQARSQEELGCGFQGWQRLCGDRRG